MISTEQVNEKSRLVRGLLLAENIIAGTLFAGMFLVITVEIITRSLFDISNLYSEELSRILMIASVYVGVALVTRDDEHIKFDLLDNLLPENFRFITSFLGDTLVLIFCLVAVYMGFSLTHQTATIGLTFTHSNLPFPVWVAQMSVPIAFSFTAIHVFARLVLRLSQRTNSNK